MRINGEWAEPGEDIVRYHARVTHLRAGTLTHTLGSGVSWPAPGLVMSVSVVTGQWWPNIIIMVSTCHAAPVETRHQLAGNLILAPRLWSDITIFLGHEHVAHTNILSQSYFQVIALARPWKQCWMKLESKLFFKPFTQAIDDLDSWVMTGSGVESGQSESLLT